MTSLTDNDAAEPVNTQHINLTKLAISKIESLLAQETSPLFLRIYIQGGGCSGFEYGFEFSNEPMEGDYVWTDPSTMIEVRIDPLSLQYLQGVTIDYKRDLQGERFSIHNPNATQTCGCGNSFSV